MLKSWKLATNPLGLAMMTLACSLATTGCKPDSKKPNAAGDPTDSSGSGGSAGGPSAGDSGGGDSVAGSGGAAGAGGCQTPALDREISIGGVYQDDYGFSHRVSDDAWVSGDSRFEVLDWSNDERWIVVHNDPDNEFNSDLYSRFEWTWDGDVLFYCQSVYDAPSEANARSRARADGDDLYGGCGGFSWSRLTGIEIVGTYDDNYGGQHEISVALWQAADDNFHLLAFSNEDNWAVYQNDCGNAYNPGLYSRFEWTLGELGAAGAAGAASTLHYCQIGFDAESERAATDLSPADAEDLARGCNGFGWSELTRRD